MTHSPLMIGLIGSLLASIAILLTLRWRQILCYARIGSTPLDHIEKRAQKLPKTIDIIVTNLLTVLFVVLSAQYIATVYALTFTLNQTDIETGDDSTTMLFDFDDDGDLDYVVLNNDASSTTDFESHTFAAGGYTSGATFGDSLGAGRGAAGDIDGDGDVDIVNIADYQQTIEKHVNIGGGSFTSYNIATFIPHNSNIVLLDVDNDGDLDIIVMGTSAQTQPLYLNDGHGNFTATNSPLPGTRYITTADFDSDGHIDLALATASGLRIYKNSGTGAFVELANMSAVDTLNATAAGDIDGDGDIDLIGMDTAAAGVGDIYRLENNGLGTNFNVPSALSSAKSGLRGIGIADVNSDGNMDLIAVSGLATGGSVVFTGDGAGNFVNSATFGTTENTQAFAYGDIDADGDIDVIHGNYGQNVTYLSDQSTILANTAPTAPSSLTGAIQPRLPKNGVTFASDSAVGIVPWVSPSNAATSNDVDTTATMATTNISHYLKATNFRFSIPTDATIHGIKVDVERSAAGTCTIMDSAVRAVKGGTIQSTDKSSLIAWPTSLDEYTSYGGPTDLWGTTWTAANINASDFGFALSVQCTAGNGGASVDHIRITVYYSALDVTLSWGSGSDAFSPTKMLQYQVRVGTGSNAHNIMSSKTASTQWISRIMPNGQSRMLKLKNLPCRTGLTYYWAVSTVDTGLMRAAATEQTFTLNDNCGLEFGGGGGPPPPPPPPPPAVGGGLPASYFRRNTETTSASPGNGLLIVSAFNDVDGNGIKNGREENRFKGLEVTASGRTVEDIIVRKTLTLGEKGEAAFDLPPSDDRGYWVLTDTGSIALTGFEPTALTASGGYVIRTGTITNVTFGFRRSDLLRYKPCISVGPARDDEVSGSDAEILMQRLENSFGQKMTLGTDIQDGLISRKDFFTLLLRTQCIDPIRDKTMLEEKLRDTMKTLKIRTPLIDLPVDVTKADSLLVYSLLAAGVDIGRTTSIGDAADLRSPITREEALRALMTIMQVPAEKTTETGVLPKDIDAKDPLAKDFLSLQNLGVLPDSFQPIFGRNQGLDSEETSLMLVRAAFRAGKIYMLSEPINTKDLKKAGSKPTFLAGLPALKPRACLEKEPARGSTVTFTDILPGDTFYSDVRDLLSYGTHNTAKQNLWLFAATRRPTEFGIARGQTKIGIDEPVSLLETIRDALILACIPPDTAIDVMSGKSNAGGRQGSGESRVARDRISDLPRNATFASRVLYKSQDHQREFDLSLFTYAPNFLRMELRSPGSGLSIDEAADILASTLLMIHVKSRTMSPQEAETYIEPLRAAIIEDLVGKDVNWRDEAIVRTTPFTRKMLLQFLATATSGRTSVTSVAPPPSVPLGEAWWERIR